MKSMCQLQLCLYMYYTMSFNAFPYPLVILVHYLEVNHKIAMVLEKATPRQLIPFRRFLFLTYYFFNLHLRSLTVVIKTFLPKYF